MGGRPSLPIRFHAFYIQRRMDDRKGINRRVFGLGSQPSTRGQALARDVQQHVLPVPPRYVVSLPDPRPDAIDRHEVVRSEEIPPVFRPLLVSMIGPALERNRSGEEDDPAERGQRLHQRRRSLNWKMFRNFHADHEIECPSDLERGAEISDPETLARNPEIGAVVVLIHADDVGYPVFAECREPVARPGPEIDDRRRRGEGNQKRNDGSRGLKTDVVLCWVIAVEPDGIVFWHG